MANVNKLWSDWVPDEAAMTALGARLAKVFPESGLIYLHGDLGAGKSTLVRSFIKARGYSGHVKSPTYTIVEPYQVTGHTIYHLDLYRIADPEELEFIGIRDLLSERSLVLVEWPDKGAGVLPTADLDIYIAYSGQGRDVSINRASEEGMSVIKVL